MKWIEKITTHLTSQPQRPYAIRLFSLLVYGWFVLNAIMLWTSKEYMWGTENVFYRQGRSDSFLENFFYQLIYAPYRFPYFFYPHVVCAILSLFEKKWSFIPRIITWATGLILYYAAVEAFNSGMLLMLLLALYASFIYTKTAGAIRNIITHLAIYACMIQVIIVYLVAAIYKLSGEQWLAGEAMYYTLHIDHFASPWWRESGIVKMTWLMIVLTYFGLIYQVVFPVLVWVKKCRPWFLLLGVLFHLFIGIFLHLWDFASAMIFSYTVFMSDETAKKMLIFRTLRK